MPGFLATASRFVAAASVVAAAGCSPGLEDLLPPSGQFYFPTGVMFTPGHTGLVVVNSDFDLQYAGGTIELLDWTPLREKVRDLADALADGATDADACALVASDLGVNPSDVLHPGPCAPLSYASLAPFFRGSVITGAFGSAGTIVTREDGPGARLFVPVRGDPSITFVDLVDDRPGVGADWGPCTGAFCLSCGAADGDPCPDTHRLGVDPAATLRELETPVEPFGISSTSEVGGGAQPVVSLHQVSPGQASLVANGWDADPTFEFILSNLSVAPTEIASIPVPRVARAGLGTSYQPGFVGTNRGTATLDVYRFDADANATPPRPFLVRQTSVGITQLPTGSDNRGVVIDGAARAACEDGCPTGDVACLRACTAVPLDLYVASRSPSSLLVGKIETTLSDTGAGVTGATDHVSILRVVPLAQGPSRLVVGDVVSEAGTFARRVFVAAFDARVVFVYDPELQVIEKVVRVGRGPQSLVIDSGVDARGPWSHLVVAQFTDSYLGVVDLDLRRPNGYGAMLLSLGEPIRPREEK